MKPLRFGLIGHGRFGRHYERLLGEIPGVKLAAIVTRHTLTSVEDVLYDPTIDAVIIATPASAHAALIAQSLAAGKHILVEKPMVTSTAEAEMLGHKMQNYAGVFMVGFQYLYNDSVIEIKKSLHSLGQICYYLGEHLSSGPVRDDVGVFMDAGVHDLSILEYLFQPGEVVDAAGKRLMFNHSALDGFTAVTVTFKSGLMAHLITSWNYPEKVRRISIVGKHSSTIYDDLAVPQKREPLRNELEHFINCIQNKKRPLTDFAFGARITKHCETILQSIKT